MNNTINQVNKMLNNSVAYATKTKVRGGYELLFANTNKTIITTNNKEEYPEKVD